MRFKIFRNILSLLPLVDTLSELKESFVARLE